MKAQGQGAGTFNIGPSTGIVKLAKELDFEDLRQPHIYQLLVTATEDSGGFSTSVELTIKGQIFWDGHKNLKKSATLFCHYILDLFTLAQISHKGAKSLIFALTTLRKEAQDSDLAPFFWRFAPK